MMVVEVADLFGGEVTDNRGLGLWLLWAALGVLVVVVLVTVAVSAFEEYQTGGGVVAAVVAFAVAWSPVSFIADNTGVASGWVFAALFAAVAGFVVFVLGPIVIERAGWYVSEYEWKTTVGAGTAVSFLGVGLMTWGRNVLDGVPVTVIGGLGLLVVGGIVFWMFVIDDSGSQARR